MITKIIFWISLVFILYTYVGYPLYLLLLSRLLSKPVNKKSVKSKPYVSVVIAAKDESENIERRINNLLRQDYPSDKLEIIIVSDGSTDATQEIVQQIAADQGPDEAVVRGYGYPPPSRGKPTALNLGLEHATGNIVVFTDARQRFAENAIMELIENFSDPSVGGVSGELVFFENSESNIKAQMGAYWEYEKKIRRMESASGSVVGATGAIYAIRRELYQPLPPATLLDDVLTPMSIAMQGYRIVFDGQATAYDTVSKNMGQEWSRKVRTLAGNWQLLSLNPLLLDPIKNRLLFRFFSHKLARLLVPFFLPPLLLCSMSQAGVFFAGMTLLQVLFYGTAVAGWVMPLFRHHPLVRLVCFFCFLNLAAASSFFVWITGRCDTVWSEGRANRE